MHYDPKAYDAAIAEHGQPDKNGHVTRFSDASTFDEVCVLCGAKDGVPRGMHGDAFYQRCPCAPLIFTGPVRVDSNPKGHFIMPADAEPGTAIYLKAGSAELALMVADLINLVLAGAKFRLGDRVKKTKGSSWRGKVVGWYSTGLTPIGYAVESSLEPGSVQIYPEAALDRWDGNP
jgi:dihydrofolate reductase (trimethoprim resistance protein)